MLNRALCESTIGLEINYTRPDAFAYASHVQWRRFMRKRVDLFGKRLWRTLEPQHTLADMVINASVLEQMFRELEPPPIEEQPDRPLYHYTDAAGLLGILQTGTIWATHFLQMNDRTELRRAEEIVGDELENLRKHAPQDGPIDGLLQFVRLAHGSFSLSSMEIFIASMTSDGNLLSQWRGYADDGRGYSIGFSRAYAQVKRPTDGSAVRGAPTIGVALVKCQYDEEAFRARIRDTLIKIADKFKRYADTFGHKPENRIPLGKVAVHCAVVAIAQLVPRYKHHAFIEEMEWRLVAVPSPLEPFGGISFRTTRRGLVSYMPVPLSKHDDRLELEKIYLGPNQDADSSARVTRMLVASLGYDPKLVMASGHPYRG